jgi:tetratricopeptide (TPR) repeat protein
MARLCLGTIYVDTGELEKAETTLQETEDLLADVDDKQQLAGLHFERGRMYKKKGAPEKAKDHLLKALGFFEEMGMKTWAQNVRRELEGF